MPGVDTSITNFRLGMGQFINSIHFNSSQFAIFSKSENQWKFKIIVTNHTEIFGKRAWYRWKAEVLNFSTVPSSFSKKFSVISYDDFEFSLIFRFGENGELRWIEMNWIDELTHPYFRLTLFVVQLSVSMYFPDDSHLK